LDLYRETLDIFKERKFIKTNLILPTYIASIGSHMFNFMNKHKKVYWYGDTIPDMRLHIFMVTIPGFGKTYLLNQFMSKYNGLLKDSAVNVGKIGSLTSSGLVGSVKSTPDGQTIVNKGVLQKKADYILGSDEFSNITTSSKAAHSANLINDLLSAFDDGEMHKDQSGGGIEYETFATVWGATQPGRYELKAGLPRRFAFVIYMPDISDVYKFRKIRQESQNVKLNVKRILEYRVNLAERYKDIKEVLTRIEFSDEWYKWIHKRFATHYEDMIYERILLGYWLMKIESIPQTLILGLNDEVEKIIDQQLDARLQIAKGIEKIKIMEVLKNMKQIKYQELLRLLLTFGLPEKYILGSLDALIANKFISIEKDSNMVINLMYKKVT